MRLLTSMPQSGRRNTVTFGLLDYGALQGGQLGSAKGTIFTTARRFVNRIVKAGTFNQEQFITRLLMKTSICLKRSNSDVGRARALSSFTHVVRARGFFMPGAASQSKIEEDVHGCGLCFLPNPKTFPGHLAVLVYCFEILKAICFASQV
jgi:hypothetical protein